MLAQLRPMLDSDLQITYEWRNDPIVRQFAMSDHEISWAEHEAVYRFNNALKLIFEFDGKPAGFVSVSRDEETTEGTWSFHMAPDARGKGLSIIMLRMALLYLKNEGYTKIHSEVKIENGRSFIIHLDLHFKVISTDNYHVLEKDL